MGIFGWSYPPGAASDPYAPYNQQDGPCEVCFHDLDHCVCPKCSTCGAVGDRLCYVEFGRYRHHGLTMTPLQRAARQWNEREQAKAIAAEHAMEEAWARDLAEGRVET